MNTLIIILLRITNVVVHIYDSTAAAHNILIQLLECAIPPPTRMPIFQKRKGFFLSDFEFDGDTRDLLVTKFTDFQDIFRFLREKTLILIWMAIARKQKELLEIRWWQNDKILEIFLDFQYYFFNF